jgi:hypothetical protein
MTIRARLGLIAVSVLAAVVCLPAAQQTQEPTQTISGRVVDGTTGEPIAGAEVTYNIIIGSGDDAYVRGDFTPLTTTGADGAFVAPGLPTGAIHLALRKEGYAGGVGYLAPDDGGNAWRFLTLAPGEHARNLVLKLWRYATIRGVLLDDGGDPVIGASVHAVRRRYYAGEATVSGTGGLGMFRTDDRGRYELQRIVPGEYFVVAPAPPLASTLPRLSPTRNEPWHLTVFHPASMTMAGAIPIKVNAGDVIEGINLTVPIVSPSRALSIAGRLGGPAERIGVAAVRLVPADAPPELWSYESQWTETNEQGAFRFNGVRPGSYRLLVRDFPDVENVATFSRTLICRNDRGGEAFAAMCGPIPRLPDQPTLWADVPVALESRSLEDVLVPLQAGARIRGRVVFEGGSARPSADHLPLTLAIVTPVPSVAGELTRIPQARVEADGTFTSIGLPPGTYGMSWSTSTPAVTGWHAEQVHVSGVERLRGTIDLGTSDLTDVVITVADRRAEITGVVNDRRGEPTWEARVIVLPRDQQRWQRPSGYTADAILFPTPLDRHGRFSLQVRPGDYLVAAISSVPPEGVSKEFLQSLIPLAQRVQVTRGQKIDLALRVLPAP